MGLFSDLLGKAGDVKLGDLAKALDKAASDIGKAVGEAAEKAGIDLKDLAEKAKAAEEEKAAQGAAGAAQGGFTGYTRVAAGGEEDGPSGFSWGPVMSEEENQYNYGGTYLEYFDHIFADDFPGYEFKREPGYGGRTTVYTLGSNGSIALIVELLPSRSESKKLRESCAQQGIPYLRFYIDYEGWWNTRAYVDDRVKKALGI